MAVVCSFTNSYTSIRSLVVFVISPNKLGLSQHVYEFPLNLARYELILLTTGEDIFIRVGQYLGPLFDVLFKAFVSKT